MKFIRQLENELNNYLVELNSDLLTNARCDEIITIIKPIKKLLDEKVPKILISIADRRDKLREYADNIYKLMLKLIERCNRLPKRFSPGIIKQIWSLGFKSPKKELESLIRNAILNPEFDYKLFEKRLKISIDKTNIIAEMLERSERKLILYNGERDLGWILLVSTFSEQIDNELELYENDTKELLRPCVPMTYKWTGLVRVRKNGMSNIGI